MLTKEKLNLTYIGKDEIFQKIFKKLVTGSELEFNEKSYLLSCAILFLNHYVKDKRFTSYADFAYFIILKYSVYYNDYKPLFDYAINFGFYPIAKSIFINNSLNTNLIYNCLMDIELDKFNKGDNYIETLEQYSESNRFLRDNSNEKGYFAPTSFGKSTLIIDQIKQQGANNKIVIVVPTKSLLMQTYQMIREAELNRKIIIHDEMYDDESSFIAVFTQERSLRLISRRKIFFDVLFIDEAHNILKNDSRSILLSRLIAKNRSLNANQKIIYLSPLIENIESLKIFEEQELSPHIIKFNIKEPEIYEYRLSKKVYIYNRFTNDFFPIETIPNIFKYIKKYSESKNFLYSYSPTKIELLAKNLCKNLLKTKSTENVSEIKWILTNEVHKDFYAVKYLEYGVIYLHGKLPDLIKEYLEYKFKTLPELKYIIANSVILEGMNLPIDTLFILNTYSLQGKELMNLIGRVNRLNSIFPPNSNLNSLGKLMPKIHFLNSEKYNRKKSKMENKISLLRSRIFEDKVENPILTSFDIDKLPASKKDDEKYRDNILSIQKNESFLYTHPDTLSDKIKLYLIESGINQFYDETDDLVEQFISKMNSIHNFQIRNWDDLPIMDKIDYFFIRDIDGISDFEITRLGNKKARNYYNNYIQIGRQKSLNENIKAQFKYFKDRASQIGKNKFYFGVTYGEEARESTPYPQHGKQVYVDLSTKDNAELINLAIVKLKMEDDFISFKLNKFIVMMFDYEIISQDEYNQCIYGTSDKKKIALTKYGLSISLISRIEKDKQLHNLSFDSFNNLKGNKDFENFLHSIDDFYRFEVSRYLN